MSEFYVAILAKNSEGEIFATVPDLPGANSAAATAREALALVIDFANDYVADLVVDGHDVPPARSLSEIDLDPEDNEIGRALIPVDVPGKSVKISISVEEALLARADRAAGAEGLSRSGYIAAAIGERLRSRREVKAATGIPEFLSRFHDAQIMAEQRSGPVLVVPMDGGQQNMNLFQRIIGAFEKGADVPVADRAKAVSKKSAQRTTRSTEMAKSSGKVNPKGTRKVRAERGIFERVSTNWNEQKVAIRRATRNKAKVDGKLFDSVYAAFVSLGLPQGDHEDFRKALKIKKRLPYKLADRTYRFEIV